MLWLFGVMLVCGIDAQEVIEAKRLDSTLRSLALIGAEQRLRQLAEEAARLHRAFPELKTRDRDLMTLAEPKNGRGRRRHRLSVEARKRISDAQKARWAKRRTSK